MIQIQNNYQSLEADNILSLLEKFRHPGKGSNHTKRKKRNLRVLIYIRKSVIVIGAVHYSPEEQERECRAYAERQGWEVVAVIYDLDETGRNADRDGFQEGLNLVRTGEIDIFLTMYVDRTYRNGFKFPIFIDFLDKYKVRLVSVNENFDRYCSRRYCRVADLVIVPTHKRSKACPGSRWTHERKLPPRLLQRTLLPLL
jgi:hypothetical protein